MDLIKRGLRKNLGNGQSIYIFRDPWIPRPSTFKVVTQPIPLMEDAIVADFITPSIQLDVVKLNQFFISHDVEAIQCLPISSSVPDKWIWHYDSKGEYSVKSGYKLSMMTC